MVKMSRDKKGRKLVQKSYSEGRLTSADQTGLPDKQIKNIKNTVEGRIWALTLLNPSTTEETLVESGGQWNLLL